MDQTDEFQFDQLFLVVADIGIGHLQAEVDQFDQLSTKSRENVDSLFEMPIFVSRTPTRTCCG